MLRINLKRKLKMKLKWKCDKQEQIRHGIDPRDEIEVEVDLTALTPPQRAKLADGFSGLLVEGTCAEVAAELQRAVDEDEKKRTAIAGELADLRARIAASRVVPGNGASEAFGGSRCVVRWPTWEVEGPYISPYSDLREEAEKVIAPLRAEAERLTAEAKAEAMAAAKPEIDAAIKAQAEAEAAENAEKAARFAATLARRAEIGAVEIEISRGDRDWGTPWGAKVSCGHGKDDYDFTAATYDLGTETLTICCAPGDVIAWGQKNFRKPKRTMHERHRVKADWRLETL